ncbi:phosphoribosyl-ATP diphosphatase [Rhodoligotrophos defluvii]|uniref:phosphoribosyl-ATP diphosphatase n=1 Tax=Rhodoligotrophos defluvii TaxID=2561934 RepID=UPI0010C96C82|nr:phosphoribosyl-ATP diphosphatase [Rhodoligotrophos defluvii]
MTTATSHKLDVLARLIGTVHERRLASADSSYTAQLVAKGVPACAKKLGEEAVEVVIAAASGDRGAVVSETADLLYHLTVLLEAADVPVAEVMTELERREGTSGIVEKARRS